MQAYIGIVVVYARNLYGQHARVCRSRHRLARRRPRLLCQEAIPRGKFRAGPTGVESLADSGSNSSHARFNRMDRIPRTCHWSRKILAGSASWTIHPSAITGTKASRGDVIRERARRTLTFRIFLLANALPIEGWTSDPNDEALLDALPVLDSLRFTSDVRKVLGIRGF